MKKGIIISLIVIAVLVASWFWWKSTHPDGIQQKGGSGGSGGNSNSNTGNTSATKKGAVTQPTELNTQPAIRDSWNAVLNDLASKKVPLTRGGTSGNRTKMQEWAFEQASYKAFKDSVMNSSLDMPTKLNVIEVMRQTLWDGIFKDYKASRIKRLQDAATKVMAYSKQVADMVGQSKAVAGDGSGTDNSNVS
jgi:hypothetical protein